MKNDAKSLTNGVIYKQILFFFFPIFLGSLFQQFYSLTDTIVVGRFVGKEAFAAIDATSILSSIIINFFVGVSSGATIILSQRFGAKDFDGVKKSMTTAIYLSGLAGLIIMLIGFTFARPLLGVLKVPTELMDMSMTYINIYFLGALSLTIYNIASGLLRALGDSKTPLYILMIGTIANVFLDILFVVIFKMGVAGAAYATISCMTITAILAVIALKNKPMQYNLSLASSNFCFSILKLIIIIGLPIGLESSLYDVSNFIIRRSINNLGTDVMAAWGVVGRIDAIIWMFLDAFGISLTTFVGQNYGAGKYKRIRKGMWITSFFTLIGILALSVIIITNSVNLSLIFVDDMAVADITKIIIGILAPAYFLFVPSKVLGAVIRGSGQSLIPMLFTLFGTCILRLLWIFFVVNPNPGVEILMVCYPITWLITGLLFSIYYIFYSKKFKKSSN